MTEIEPFEITVRSLNGFETAKIISPKLNSEDIYLFIDKKKKAPWIKEVMSSMIEKTKMLMTPENKVNGSNAE